MSNPSPTTEQAPGRILLMLCTGALPLGVVGTVFYAIGYGFPLTLPEALQTPRFETDATALVPAMLQAANHLIVSVAFMAALSLAILGYVTVRLIRHTDRMTALLFGTVVITAAIGFARTPNNALAGLLFDVPLVRAVDAGLWDAAAFQSVMENTMRLGMALGMVGILSMVALFMMLCLAPPTDRPASQALSERAASLRLALILSGLLLTVGTLTTYFFYIAPRAMMIPAEQATHTLLGAHASVRWGGAYTITILCTVTPPLAVFFHDRGALVHAGVIDTAPPLFPGGGMAANLRRAAAAIAVLAPASIVPVMDAVKTLFSTP